MYPIFGITSNSDSARTIDVAVAAPMIRLQIGCRDERACRTVMLTSSHMKRCAPQQRFARMHATVGQLVQRSRSQPGHYSNKDVRFRPSDARPGQTTTAKNTRVWRHACRLTSRQGNSGWGGNPNSDYTTPSAACSASTFIIAHGELSTGISVKGVVDRLKSCVSVS